ncbi:MAG TPA: metallophosphoesterase [Bdellovibrionota bacterium]|nr:metallophosphoesterase [Bdellovibrionota bacterium]
MSLPETLTRVRARTIVLWAALLMLAGCSAKVQPVIAPKVEVKPTPLTESTGSGEQVSPQTPVLPPADTDPVPAEGPSSTAPEVSDGSAPPPMAPPPPPPAGGNELFPEPQWAVVSLTELRSFDAVFAMSDIHGTLKLLTPLLIRAGLILPTSTDQRYLWAGSNARGRRFLFVIVGDSINKGPDSAAVLLRIKELQDQASSKGGRVIAVLGNHEAEFLAEPSQCDEEFLDSAKKFPELQRGGKLSCKDLGKGPLGEFMQSMPVGAVVGTWMFSHSGYFDYDLLKKARTAPQKQAVAAKFLRDTTNARAKGDFRTLVDEDRSILKTHDWWQKHLPECRDTLQLLGLTGMVVGHEPGFMGAEGEIAMNKFGWLMKLDAGMNPDREDSKGRVLKCQVGLILPPNARGLQMMNAGRPLCSQFGPKQEQAIPVKNL